MPRALARAYLSLAVRQHGVPLSVHLSGEAKKVWPAHGEKARREGMAELLGAAPRERGAGAERGGGPVGAELEESLCGARHGAL